MSKKRNDEDFITSYEYPWMRELDQLGSIRDQELAALGTPEFKTGIQPQDVVPVEEVLKYAEAMRSQPEIWEEYVKEAAGDNEDEGMNTDLLNYFRSWYMLKHNKIGNGVGYIKAGSILRCLARGEIKEIRSNESVELVIKSPWVSN